MRHDDNVLAALAYRRNVGATQKEIRTYLTFREDPKRKPTDDLKSLKALQKKGLVVKVADTWFHTLEGYKKAKGPALAAEWQRHDATMKQAYDDYGEMTGRKKKKPADITLNRSGELAGF